MAGVSIWLFLLNVLLDSVADAFAVYHQFAGPSRDHLQA